MEPVVVDIDVADVGGKTQLLSDREVREVGDYELLHLLGVGGMGEVFLARQKSVDRQVAVKILLPALGNNQNYLKRFFSEVRHLAKIDHPGVVRAIEAGVDKNVCYFSMMYAVGNDVKRLLSAKGPFSEKQALNIVKMVAEALDYAWQRHQMIHRDIKPANIMVCDDGQIKLLDLGISKFIDEKDEDKEATKRGMMVGSPYYMSPEQSRGEAVDFRSDIYSLGATLYMMLTGKPPFDGESTMAVISQHCSSPVPDPRLVQPSISHATVLLINRMMAKSPEQRFGSWQELIREVEKIRWRWATHPKKISIIGRFFIVCHDKLRKLFNDRRVLLLAVITTIITALLLILILLNVITRQHQRHRQMLNDILEFAAHHAPEQHDLALRKLNYLIKNGSPRQIEQAKFFINKIHQEMLRQSEVRISAKIAEALELINRQSLRLEQQHKYAEAIKLWRYYLHNSSLRKHQKFIDAAQQAIRYFQQCQQKEQVDVE